MERILEEYRWIDGIERSFGLPSHPSTGSTRGVERERRAKTGPEAGPAKTHVPTMRRKTRRSAQ